MKMELWRLVLLPLYKEGHSTEEAILVTSANPLTFLSYECKEKISY